jgi:hypothetical protein
MKTIKLPKALAERINEVNDLIKIATDECIYVTTYAGGTWPYVIDIKPISVNGKFVTIEAVNPKHPYAYINKQRYCITKTDEFADNGLAELKYNVGIIRKALISAIREESKRLTEEV